MKINYNVSGNERKKVVKLISEITEVPSKYLGVPSCAYQVGPYHIGKDGELTFDSEVGQDDIKSLMKKLLMQGLKLRWMNQLRLKRNLRKLDSSSRFQKTPFPMKTWRS